ncbi:MAG: periplasmic heavy metal sensor [Deltaproteobacteria bacterium]|nr:periplasmic heavy metal sensor [Deltaproteobacteria bacterium]
MKKLMMIGLVVAVVGATSIMAFSWGPGFNRGGGGAYGPGACWANSDRQSLTEEQEAKLDALDKQHFDETRKLRRELWTKRDKLDELMSGDNPDRNQVMSLQKEMAQLRDQLQEKNLDYALEAKKIAPDLDKLEADNAPGRGRRGYGPMMRGGYGMGGYGMGGYGMGGYGMGGYGMGQGGGPGYCWR